jgi:hypothetical protein
MSGFRRGGAGQSVIDSVLSHHDDSAMAEQAAVFSLLA